MGLLKMSFTGAILILVIVVIRAIAIHRLPKKTFLVLWIIALTRLLLPFSVPSPFSVYSLVRGNEPDFQTSDTVVYENRQPMYQVEVEQIQNNPVVSNTTQTLQTAPHISIWTTLWIIGMLIFAGLFLVSYLRCRREFRTALPMRTRHQANYHATDCYVCAGYRKAIKSCTAHYIREDKLTELVLAEIQSVIEDYHKSPKTFTKRIQQKLTADGVNNVKQTQKRLSYIVERIAEIEVYIQQLFEEKVKGNISQEVFANLSKKYSDDKAGLLAERESLKRVENESKQFVKKFNHFIAVVENIKAVTEVTPDILRELIDRIEVFEGEKIPKSRMKSAKIKVFFNGIGALN